MNSILAVALLIAVLSLCNLTDKSKPNDNSNSSHANTSETRTTDAGNDPEPDRAEVTVELMKIEYDLTTASYNGDISTLASFIHDDYLGTAPDGSTQTKNQVLAATKPDKLTKSWKISEGELVSLSKDSAVLTYIQSQTLKNGQTFRFRVTDTFVKEKGRWLIKSEQQTFLK